MSQLILDNHIIKAPIINIIKQIKMECLHPYFKSVTQKHDYIRVNCPYHKDGLENHPSCGIYCGNSDDYPYGFLHCFSCGATHNICQWVGYCFDSDENFGKEWLLARFGDTILKEESNYLEPIELNNKKIKSSNYLDESILDKFQSYHPYMTQRKLSQDIISKFKIKYDQKDKCIVFPVWDAKGNLITLTKRSVEGKKFNLELDVDKPVYLLNYIIKNNIKEVYVCESQINTLTCFEYGVNAVGLFGTGSKHQYELLKKSGINIYHLALDGDDAGKKGIYKFISNMPKECLIDIVDIPKNKDVNDLSKEEFLNLPKIDMYYWLNQYKKLYK